MRARRRRVALMHVALLCLSVLPFLSACVVVPDEPPPEPVAELPLPLPPPHAPPPPFDAVATWRFEQDDGACRARAVHRDVALMVVVPRRAFPVTLTAQTGPRRRVAEGEDAEMIGFNGRAGSWQRRGRMHGDRAVVASVQADEETVHDLLGMLGGGTLEVGGRRSGLPQLYLPPARVAGRGWSDCLRRRLAEQGPPPPDLSGSGPTESEQPPPASQRGVSLSAPRGPGDLD
jgi:hypothetical protein